MSKPHVLIIGGGITGLLLAQTLKKNDVSFSIFERDTHETSRDPGWGLAIHWAKEILMSLLPIELQEGLLEANVDPDAARKGDCGRFPYFNLRDGQERYTIPSKERIRLSRGKWRNLLMRELTIEVSTPPYFRCARVLCLHIPSSGRKSSHSSHRTRSMAASQLISPTALPRMERT